MQRSARWIAALAVPFLLTTFSFAGDDAKPSTAKDTSTTASASSAPAAQATPSPAPATKTSKVKSMFNSARGENTPAGELFFGYSYLRLRTNTGIGGGLTRQEHFDYIPGGAAAIQGNINNWLGLKADFGGYGLHDVGGVDGKMFTYLFGPVFSFGHGRFTPFVHALVGGARLTSRKPTGFVGDTAFFGRPGFHQNSFAGDGGGGLDLNANKYFAIRLAQADYLYTQFNDFNNDQQHNLRLSGGFVIKFGYGEAPPPPVKRPPTATCSANPATVHAETGETSTVRADAASPDNLPLTYTWTASGGSVDGTGPQVRWVPGTAAPGTYTVSAHVDDGQGGTVNCSADIQLQPRPNRPPVMSCAAAAPTAPVGQRVQINATASDPDNDPLTFSWQASGGQIVGSGAQVQLDTTGLAPGHYTVTGQVSDGRGGTADCKVDVELQIPIEQKQLETKLALHSIFFPTAQPTVKNPNGGLLPSQQRTLLTAAGDFKKYLTYRPDAQLNLRGHADPRGSVAYNMALSDRRVARAKAFLVEQGVPADKITTEGLGEEQSLTPAEIKSLADQDTTLTADQKTRIAKNAKAVALAQNRRVDMTLSTTGQTSQRAYPFNAEDVLNLINPRGTAPAPKGKRPAPRRKRPAAAPKPQ